MAKNRVEVIIGGEIITLVSEENEAYMQKVALYIDKKMEAVNSSKTHKPLNDHLKSLLLQLNIADDYFKSEEYRDELEDSYEKALDELEKMKEKGEKLAERVKDYNSQLEQGKRYYEKETAQLQEDNVALVGRVQALQNELIQDRQTQSSEMDYLRQEVNRLDETNRDLQEQLHYARRELEEYVSTLGEGAEEKKKVVNFKGR